MFRFASGRVDVRDNGDVADLFHGACSGGAAEPRNMPVSMANVKWKDVDLVKQNGPASLPARC
jgi:hypothetical protein